jgi:hypothetical protein
MIGISLFITGFLIAIYYSSWVFLMTPAFDSVRKDIQHWFLDSINIFRIPASLLVLVITLLAAFITQTDKNNQKFKNMAKSIATGSPFDSILVNAEPIEEPQAKKEDGILIHPNAPRKGDFDVFGFGDCLVKYRTKELSELIV